MMKLYSLRWYHLYFLLAAFSVTTVSFSLVLNHHLTSIFKGAVDTNLNYLELQDSLNQLGITLSTVNAPGNDIFDSQNVSRERTRLDESLIVANQRVQSLQYEIRALRDRTLLSEPEFLDFVGDLNRIKGRLSEMASEARLIFSLFESNQPVKAGSRMATMDQKYSLVSEALSELREDVLGVMQDRLTIQQSRTEDLRWIEYLIWGLALALIGGVSISGRRIAQAMRVHEHERELQLKEISSARDLLAVSNQRAHALASNAPVGIFETDDAGKCTFVNDQWCTIAGLSPSQALDDGWGSAIHPEDRHGVMHAWGAAVQEYRPFSMEYRFLTPHGKVTWVYGSSAPLKNSDGLVRGYVGSLTNITARKEIEEAMATARRLAEEAARAKGEFLANMSHEIRTPMNGILGMTELLLSTKQTDEQSDLAQTIKTSASALLTIINDILDFSKIEAGKLQINPEPTSIREEAQKIARLNELELKQKKLNLVVTIDPRIPEWILVDPGRLRQVLINLVGNATKFTETGGAIVLSGAPDTSSPTDAPRITFQVTDTGIGIPDEKQSAIFEAFSQADRSTTRRFGGTGLGLTISSQLVRLMGGNLQVNSRPGVGSCFYFSIPLLESKPPEIAHSPDQPLTEQSTPPSLSATRPLRILVAEDNLINQKLLKAVLSKFGHSVQMVDNGEKAVAAARSEKFDLVLMDVQMPVLGGEGATQQIRAREKATGSRLPIIAVTANAMAGDREAILSAGMDDYISKPINTQELIAAIDRLTAEGTR